MSSYYEEQYAKFDEINKTRPLTDAEVDKLAKLVRAERHGKSRSKRSKDQQRVYVQQWRAKNPEKVKEQNVRRKERRKLEHA